MDDRAKTPRLADLNGRYLQFVTPEERLAKEQLFKGIRLEDKTEHQLLKSALELSLVLPRCLSDQRSSPQRRQDLVFSSSSLLRKPAPRGLSASLARKHSAENTLTFFRFHSYKGTPSPKEL